MRKIADEIQAQIALDETAKKYDQFEPKKNPDPPIKNDADFYKKVKKRRARNKQARASRKVNRRGSRK